MTSSTVALQSNWYWIHWSVPTAGRSSALGYLVPSSHINSTTSPCSFIPPVGNSLPYWLKLKLPYLDTQLIVFPSFVFIEVFFNPRRLVNNIPSPDFQS